MSRGNEKEIAVEKLQNALLKLPKDDLIKLLKNTYQAMRIKHCIPHEKKFYQLSTETGNHTSCNKTATKKSTKFTGNIKNVLNGSSKIKNTKTTQTQSGDDRKKPQLSDKESQIFKNEDGSTDEECENADLVEQPTFRKCDPDVPQLDLSKITASAGENCISDDGRVFRLSKSTEETPLTPTFSPRSDTNATKIVEGRKNTGDDVKRTIRGDREYKGRDVPVAAKDDRGVNNWVEYPNTMGSNIPFLNSFQLNNHHQIPQHPPFMPIDNGQILFGHPSSVYGQMQGMYQYSQPGSCNMMAMPYVRKMNVQRPFYARCRSLQRL